MSSFLGEFVSRAIKCINKWEYPYQYWTPTIIAVIIQKVQGKEPEKLTCQLLQEEKEPIRE